LGSVYPPECIMLVRSMPVAAMSCAAPIRVE
jgi:hypothetical protein